MGKRIPLNLIGEAYSDESLPFSAQDAVNCRPVQAETEGTREVVMMEGVEGLSSFGTVGVGGSRGLVKMAGLAYEVRDTQLYSVASDGSSAALGTIEGSGQVGIATNGTQILIVNGSHAAGKGYVYTTSGGLVEITDPQFPRADDCFFVSNYFWLINKTTDEGWISALGDGSSYAALDFVMAESSPDGLVGGCELNGYALLMGEETIEPWRHTGAADFPFERETTISKGLAATFAKAKVDNTVYWLSNAGIAYRLEGWSPIRVSKRPMEKALRHETLSNAFALAYEPTGYSFFVVTLGKTWVCDISNNRWWHRRASFEMERWRVNTYLYCYDKHLFGDASSGILWELDPNTFTEGSDPLVWERKSRHISENGEWLRQSELELIWESGTALATGQGSAPLVDMCYSDNGGHTWNNWRQGSLGATGEYGMPTRFHGLGRFRVRTFWIRCSEPIRRNLISANALRAE